MSQGLQHNFSQPMNGGLALAEMLRAYGADTMFGMGGFQLSPFYEAVRVLGLGHNLINDERCGAFMADAYARVTGKPGVCDGTLGPGVTNLVTGMVESLNAGVPMIVIAGDANRNHAWKNMTQEARQAEILQPAAKALIRVESARRIPELVRRAFATATSGRPGPVVLALPEDMLTEIAAVPDAPPYVAVAPAPAASALEPVRALLQAAERPMLLVGGAGWNDEACAQIRRFAEANGLPAACSFRRQDVFDNRSDCFAGDLGTSGPPALIGRMLAAKAAGAAEVEIWGTGRAVRDFLYVDDAADAILLAYERFAGPGHLNIGSGDGISIADLAAAIARVTGFTGRLRFDASRPDGMPRKVLDSAGMAALGWTPRTPLVEGLRLASRDMQPGSPAR